MIIKNTRLFETCLLFTFCLFFKIVIYADETTSFLKSDKQFLLIDDVNRESEAWATCSAAYDMSALVFESEQPAQAKLFEEKGNGAEMAVIMSIVSDAINDDITEQKFNAVWAYAKIAAKSLPETSMNTMLAELEGLDSDGIEEFLQKLVATIEICTNNLESQQAYIDSWRALS